MREIKFRAWDKLTKNMFQRSMMPLDGTHDKHVINMQFTCLKDRKGTEIYEGDIVKIMWSRGKYDLATIEWGDAGFIVVCLQIEQEGQTHEIFLNKDIHLIVIGNIYENPELLKEDPE